MTQVGDLARGVLLYRPLSREPELLHPVTGKFLKRILLVLLLLAPSVACRSPHSQTHAKKVIVLGIDGMDPNFVERHWGALPNLDRLRTQGDFKRLRTTTPPQSPVAWSTFITGMDPVSHGIFDFVHRDPAALQLFSSLSQTEPSRFTLSFGSYSIPLSKAHVTTLRKGKAFWELLDSDGIPVTVIRIPANYPPIEAGEELAGMGTPDLRGTLGTFTFYTDDPEEISRPVSGGRIVKLSAFGNHVVLRVEGPPNSLRKGQPFASVDLVVDVDPQQPLARLAVQDSLAIVRQGEWSGWLPAEFPLVRGLASATGMFRVYAKQFHPNFELYVSPVNLDPRAPELPISAPAAYSRDIAGALGPFYTQGIAEDTSALRQGVLDLQQFLAQSHLVFEDERKLLRYALRHYQGGLLFVYFSAIDQNSHVLWGQHEAELLQSYEQVDSAIGEVMREQSDADLIVMSDHGFSTFDRAVNLNTYLWKRGFLALLGPPDSQAEGLANIDWSRTQAYALGLNGLYLNLAGRDKYGIVTPGAESQAVLARIGQQLLSWRDSENGRPVVEGVYPLHAARQNAEVAPDMIVGYSPGYRASWETALGAVPGDLLYDNVDAWIADHCINAADVPGVLFSSRKIRSTNPELKDLTVSILHLFGESPAPGMTGKEIF
ncbi:MAG TPA: alkaline phosphatase family protein [Bryobacteraceae bacterium]|nr:alkaline phosphatase family protein [Bryobacteraceae bacterium]